MMEREREKQVRASTDLLAEQQQANLASEFAKQLLRRIIEFDQQLDEEHEVGMKLVSFGQSVTFHVSNIGCYNPSLILFTGYNEKGNRIELVQHISQISFLLLAVEKLNPEEPKRKCGFIQD